MTNKRRKTITDRMKLIAALARFGLTTDGVRFDHTPPLGLREWDAVAGDTIPPANSQAHIQMLTIEEDRTKTYGAGGEKRATVAGGDLHKIGKVRRISKEQLAFRARVLAKGEAPVAGAVKRKGKIPSRPFPKRRT